MGFTEYGERRAALNEGRTGEVSGFADDSGKVGRLGQKKKKKEKKGTCVSNRRICTFETYRDAGAFCELERRVAWARSFFVRKINHLLLNKGPARPLQRKQRTVLDWLTFVDIVAHIAEIY